MIEITYPVRNKSGAKQLQARILTVGSSKWSSRSIGNLDTAFINFGVSLNGIFL